MRSAGNSLAGSPPASLASPFVTVVPARDDLRALEGYHSAQVDVEVRLNTNESPLPPPAAWRDAFAAEVSRIEWHRYPDRAVTELRGAIAEQHHVLPDQVFAANGSNEVLQALLLAYGGFGRRVLTFEPTYQMHAQIARVTGATVVEGERGADFTLDTDAAVALIGSVQPAVTFLCSPNNPTGLVELPGTVRAVLEATDAAGSLLVVDEAYAQFSSWTALDLLGEDRALAVVRTFSKTWSMAGARLGYVVAPAWLIAELDKVTLPYHLDTAKQIAGRLALRYSGDMDARVQQIVAERDRVSAGLADLGVEVFPSGANFVLFRVGDDAQSVWQGLVDRSVLVRDCSGWPRLAGCLRVTIGTEDENTAFLQALREVVHAPARPPAASGPSGDAGASESEAV